VDRLSCARVLEGKSVLVTGAAGSVGSELCRQIAAFGPRRLVGLDNNESGLYDLGIELRSGADPFQLDVVIADVRDANAISRAFEKVLPDVVFHAAAYKHVPLMEEFPEEAVAVNVRGTDIVLEAARNVGAGRFVFVSTDKAVKPASLMGATKKVAEMLVMSSGHEPMLATVVRFGNVFGSRGSVVPTFARQIQRGGPVTVTHPEMTRFFMEISEAAILIIQAAAMTQGNDLFMLEMGEPVKIDDLARRMIRMRGLRPDIDIEIVYTGVRSGEKLHEELVLDVDERFTTEHSMISRIQTRHVQTSKFELAKLYELADGKRSGDLSASLMELCEAIEPQMPHVVHDVAVSN
jgi:FlaA1/EpsC-like NDP-sugar epimerase